MTDRAERLFGLVLACDDILVCVVKQSQLTSRGRRTEWLPPSCCDILSPDRSSNRFRSADSNAVVRIESELYVWSLAKAVADRVGAAKHWSKQCQDVANGGESRSYLASRNSRSTEAQSASTRWDGDQPSHVSNNPSVSRCPLQKHPTNSTHRLVPHSDDHVIYSPLATS